MHIRVHNCIYLDQSIPHVYTYLEIYLYIRVHIFVQAQVCIHVYIYVVINLHSQRTFQRLCTVTIIYLSH